MEAAGIGCPGHLSNPPIAVSLVASDIGREGGAITESLQLLRHFVRGDFSLCLKGRRCAPTA